MYATHMCNGCTTYKMQWEWCSVRLGDKLRLPAVCTPSPHTVSAPREHSRSFRTPDTDRYFSYFACFYVLRESRTHPVRPRVRTVHNGFLPSLPFARAEIQKKNASDTVASQPSYCEARLNKEVKSERKRCPSFNRRHTARNPLNQKCALVKRSNPRKDKSAKDSLHIFTSDIHAVLDSSIGRVGRGLGAAAS
ncbi:hypothetical protein EVAR_84062_1 [Eumeta japonica]|uniref:Uncharacterized protein n=1 Tax=Eumeta variegata TaxID=151549 RepID=A0A4C2A1A9_EUMVA|nr:hypothetical protein EVAR_84062_1 [Eumeta japonica]